MESTGCLWYFEWVRSETIFGKFSENVVQGRYSIPSATVQYPYCTVVYRVQYPYSTVPGTQHVTYMT